MMKMMAEVFVSIKPSLPWSAACNQLTQSRGYLSALVTNKYMKQLCCALHPICKSHQATGRAGERCILEE